MLILGKMDVPVNDWDVSPPFLSSRRHSASAWAIPSVMAVDGGLKVNNSQLDSEFEFNIS